MAARSRGDSKRAEQCFREVWKQGRPGEIFSTAAHLFGIMVRDQEIAERALRDSLEWCGTDHDRGKVWHSLGNLLSRQRPRWQEAEEAYDKSLQLLHAPDDRGQVWHSLGNLLSRQRPRWQEAEEAYDKSLRLLQAPDDQAQVWHSLGNLLSREQLRWQEAEEAYHKSVQLERNPDGRAQVWHSLGNLLSRQSTRWQEAEEAYDKSLQLLHAPDHQAQVYASWAGAIIKSQDFPSFCKAEEYARYSLFLNPRVPRHRSTVYGLLAKICAASGRYPEAIEALAAATEADRELGNTRLLRDRLAELERLRRRLQDAQHD
jgi:tetratricopeptide (TPR) repeat protein